MKTKKTISEMFEGEGSSLKRAFDEATNLTHQEELEVREKILYFYNKLGQDEYLRAMDILIGRLREQAKAEALMEVEEWAIKGELPEVTCHLSHHDLADGYNQALLKLRRFLLSLSKKESPKKK